MKKPKFVENIKKGFLLGVSRMNKKEKEIQGNKQKDLLEQYEKGIFLQVDNGIDNKDYLNKLKNQQ